MKRTPMGIVMCWLSFHHWLVFRPNFYNWPDEFILLRRECQRCQRCEVKVDSKWLRTSPLEPEPPYR